MLKPEQITAIIDTREQHPLELRLHTGEMLKSQRTGLVTGDYSVLGLENEIAIERKSLADLYGCVAKERERFEKELKRMLAHPVRAVVVESSWQNIELGASHTKVSPQSAVGSILKWVSWGIPFIMAGDRIRAGQYVARLLYGAAKERFGVLEVFQKSIEPVKKGTRRAS